MSEHTPLTEAERDGLDFIVHKRAFRSDLARNIALFTAVEQILAARTSTATADTGLRERVEALADDLTAEVEELRADIPPMGPSRVAHMYRTAGLSDARDRLRNALDAIAAPTTDTGARDE